MTTSINTPSFIEIGAQSAGGIGEFFAKVFDWQFHPTGDRGDGWLETGAIKIGLHGNDPSPGVVPYFPVTNIELAAEKVRELGGTADDNIADEEGFGRFCNCTTAEGIRFGLHQRT